MQAPHDDPDERVPMHSQLHVCEYETGHKNSVDCWCEPAIIKRMRNKHGVDVLVVHHKDYHPTDHNHVLFLRNLGRCLPPEERNPDDWITIMLDPFGNPPLLPPYERNA